MRAHSFSVLSVFLSRNPARFPVYRWLDSEMSRNAVVASRMKPPQFELRPAEVIC